MSSDGETCLPIVSLLTGSVRRLEAAIHRLRERWSTLALLAPPRSFDVTSYYEAEMGADLLRWWAYRPRLENPLNLPEWKQYTQDVEAQLADEAGNRTVNIDPGYLDHGLVVLASHKNSTHRIPMGSGVYADAVLYYSHGAFQTLPWTFPDFRDGRQDALLETLRNRYRSLKKG